MHLSSIPIQCLLLILLGSLTIVSGSSSSIAKRHFRAKRQNDGVSSWLITAVKAFILGGGVESIKGNSDKMGALQQFVSNYAVRSVLGDGIVGQVLGRGLGVSKQPTSEGGGFFSKLMGGNKGSTDSTSSSGDSSGTNSDSGSGKGFFSKLLGSVMGSGTTTTTQAPSSSSGFLSSLAAKFLGR